MSHKIIGFIDGENLVLRCKDMLKDGHKLKSDSVFIEDQFIWNQAITSHYLGDYDRLNYYQTVVGDEEKLESLAKIIASQRSRYAEWGGIQGSVSIRPRLFKKERRSSKTKSVDINLTVDVMRHAFDSRFDILIIASGDGDYIPLVEEVSRLGKQVWIAAFSKGLSPRLRYAADEFLDLDEFIFEPKLEGVGPEGNGVLEPAVEIQH